MQERRMELRNSATEKECIPEIAEETFTCSKRTIETLGKKKCEICSKLIIKTQEQL